MKKLFFSLFALLTFAMLDACKKDKHTPDDNPGGGSGSTVNVQVVLPAGSTVDLSKTSLFTYSQAVAVSADGKCNIPYTDSSYEIAYLFDNAKNLLMMGIISDTNKQITITSTTEALLYIGLGVPFSNSKKQRIDAIENIKTHEPFAGLNTALETYFKADPTMLAKSAFMPELLAAVAAIKKDKAIDIYARQIKVEDADVQKSGIKINEDGTNADNFNFTNNYLRRAHAFLYKTSFIDLSDQEKTRINNITSNTAADQNLAVKAATFNQALRMETTTTGPVSIPLAAGEKQATYKVRVVGVGGNLISSLTTAENSKLEELWMDYFALDLLMPSLFISLENTNMQFKIQSNGPDAARAYITEVKKHLTTTIMDNVKNGNYTDAIKDYMKLLQDDYYKRVAVYKQLSAVAKATVQPGDTWGILDADIEKEYERNGQVGSFATKVWDGVKTHIDNQLSQIHNKCNTMDEWTVKVLDNNVKISPRKSDALAFAYHTLTVSTSPTLAAGETLEYDWKTAGAFGVLKNGTQEGATFTTTTKTITYQGQSTPNDNNIDYVFVTAYIKNGTTRKKVGSDTATINVKKNKLEMRPDGAILTPRNGSNSIKLYLLKPDGTNDIVSNAVLDYKVEWECGGYYGFFNNSTISITSAGNYATYIANDKDVLKATENITAKVYFKAKTETKWTLRDEVKGTVKIENDPKKRIIRVPVAYLHGDTASTIPNRNVCTYAFAATFNEDPNALKYEARLLSSNIYGGNTYPTYSWNASGPYPNTLPHYVRKPYAGGQYCISFSNSGGTTLTGQHVTLGGLPTSGVAEITIYLK